MIPALLVPSVRPVASLAGGPVSGYIGDTVQLSARQYLINGGFVTPTGVSWASGNNAIATVSVTGLVTLTGAGTTIITATIGGVPYTTAAVSVLPVITDTFTRADNAATLGNTDTGQAWIAQQGTWGIVSNRAYTPVLAGDAQCSAVVQSPWADCVVSATLATADDGVGLIWRDTDNSNYLLLERESAGTVVAAFTRVGGSFTSISSAGYTSAAGDVIAAHLAGTRWIITVNAVPKLSITNSTLQTATKHGLRNTSAIARFSKFSIARANTRLITGGDSITSGFNLAPNNAWPNVLCGRSGYELFSLINTSTAGADIHTDMLGRTASDFSYYTVSAPYTNTLYIGWAGTNDIAQDNRTADLIEADMWAWFDALAALGIPRNKMACGTVIPRDSTLNGMAQATFDARAADLNSRIRANHGPHCGWVIDFAADSRYSSPTSFNNATLYLDKIHPTTPAGVNALADIASPITQQMLAA